MVSLAHVSLETLAVWHGGELQELLTKPVSYLSKNRAPMGSEPKPYAQPLDSGTAASTTRGGHGPRKPENPDFFSTMEDEQAGIRWVRQAGGDGRAGSNMLRLVPCFTWCPRDIISQSSPGLG